MSEGTPGPATHLLRSLAQLGGTLLAVAETRVELLTTEISEDLERGLRILLWAMVGLLAGILGLLLAGITVVIYFWDTHRIAAAVSVTAVFLIVSVIAGMTFRRHLNQKPRLLDATRNELHHDVTALRREQ